MIKNRTAQLVLQTVYCTLGLVAFASSIGVYNAQFQDNFYVYFTNLSNYICMGIMFAELFQTIKYANRKEDGFCTVFPALKFVGMIMLLITFLVYNFLLAGLNTLSQNLAAESLIHHVFLPVLYVADWLLFYERKKVKWFYPILSLIAPLLYVIFIFVRAAVIYNKGLFVYPVYPYFFLNVDTIGWNGVLSWIVVMLVVFIVLGYLLFFIDHIGKRNKDSV